MQGGKFDHPVYLLLQRFSNFIRGPILALMFTPRPMFRQEQNLPLSETFGRSKAIWNNEWLGVFWISLEDPALSHLWQFVDENSHYFEGILGRSRVPQKIATSQDWDMSHRLKTAGHVSCHWSVIGLCQCDQPMSVCHIEVICRLIYTALPNQCGATAERRTGSRCHGFETRLCHLVFPLDKEINPHF